MQDILHYPVLLEEIISFIPSESRDILDCTIGEGGHSSEILKRLAKVNIIGIDIDLEILKIARNRLNKYFGERLYLINTNFKNISIIKKSFDFILMDLGISMYHYKSNRGFSFSNNSLLDMRLNKSQKLKAIDIIKSYSYEDLADILKTYGDERWAYKIAKGIIENRKYIKTTKDLKEIIYESIPKKFIYKKGRIDPATKTFMALRIAVNREFENLEIGLVEAIKKLKPNGRIAVISFHSGEDRIVKKLFKNYERDGVISIVTKKPITPTSTEVKKNPASRSAKLRVAEKIHQTTVSSNLKE